VIEQAQKAPPRVLLCGREAQPSTLRDLYLLVRLVDRLENIHFFLRFCLHLDIPEQDYDENIL
jgi:trimethylamine--corrinoid protein Co-methyltransferase